MNPEVRWIDNGAGEQVPAWPTADGGWQYAAVPRLAPPGSNSFAAIEAAAATEPEPERAAAIEQRAAEVAEQAESEPHWVAKRALAKAASYILTGETP